MAVGGGISLSTTARSLIRSGFFGKDFDTYVSEIVNFLQLRFGTDVASNIVASEQGIVLIEMMAFALSTMSWYGDRQADDTTLLFVRLRAAAVTIARQLGYIARSSVPPAVSLTMTLTTPPPARLTIDMGTKMSGPNGLIFETTQQLIFDAGVVGPTTFAAREGQTLNAVFTSDGTPDQVFPITTVPTGQSIAQDSVIALVDAVQWTAEAILPFQQANVFEFQYGFNPPRLVFGDGVAGNIPPKGSEIRVSFFVTHGTSGSVPANSVTSFSAPLAVGTTIIGAVITQPQPSTPGSDPESIASIQSNAPQVFQAAGRAVTQADLDAWINSFIDPTFGGVAIGRATVPHSYQQDAEALSIIQAMINANVPADVVTRLQNYWNTVLSSNCAANVVVAQVLSSDPIGRYVTAPVGLARALETFLNAKTESTVKVHVADGSINLISVNLAVDVHVLPAFTSQEASQTVVASVIATLEAQLLGRRYGDSLRISDLYQAVEALDGVDWSHIKITNNPTRVTAPGDLPIQDFEVITLGTLPVVTLV